MQLAYRIDRIYIAAIKDTLACLGWAGSPEDSGIIIRDGTTENTNNAQRWTSHLLLNGMDVGSLTIAKQFQRANEYSVARGSTMRKGSPTAGLLGPTAVGCE